MQSINTLNPVTRDGRYIFLCLLLLAFLVNVNSCSDDSTGPNGNGQEYSYCELQPLPDPTGNIVNVSNVTELKDAVSLANSAGNWTILLEDGTYQLELSLLVTADDVTFRSASGIRDNVTIRGDGMQGTVSGLITFTGNNIIIADLTMGWVMGNAINANQDADDCLIHNVRLVDTGQQMMKVTANNGAALTERGEVRWCLFEYTAGEGPQDYIGGIMAHKADGWKIHHNTFRGIRSPTSGLGGPAILFWDESANTTVEHNTIYNCDRGILFGLGPGGIEHTGGMIRNNMVHTNRDVSIGLESAESASIYNNTVFTQNYYNSIEYRYAETQFASIINNLTNAAIAARDGATGVLETNVTSALESWFVDATGGDLRLAVSDTLVVDKGTALTAVPIDIDCENRPKGDAHDIGADEY